MPVIATKDKKFKIHTINSMEKIFPEQSKIDAQEIQSLSALKGECISFQLAVRLADEENVPPRVTAECRAQAVGETKEWVKLYRVDLAPSQFAAYPYHDENYLRTEPGMYPDILRERADFRCTQEQWKCIWVSAWIPKDAKAGKKHIEICLKEEISSETGEKTETAIGTVTVQIEVVDAMLPKQKLIRTEWFHADCLADYYQVPVFSGKWWKIVRNFIETAVIYGINMILTPIFTPPLDTDVGGERTTIQLVDIEKTDKGYQFDFEKLHRWVDMCREAGVIYFEMAHLFTQWGAQFTPKIIVKVNGKDEKLFGWHVKAEHPLYKEFLEAFLPALTAELLRLGIADKTYFHISDEPEEKHLEGYQKSKALAEPYLEGFQIIDALSDLEFYKKGIVSHPIPASDCIEPFLNAKVPDLWTYYCCAQWNKVSNRYFSLPGARTRILGAQLFYHEIIGFLHWGFNFYNSQFSKEHINPYEITDAGNAFPSGDPFLVYPGKDGKPVLSVRTILMLEAMQDMRALQLLESLAGREEAEKVLMEQTEKLTFSEYPKEAAWLLTMRERVNKEIIRQIN